MAYNSEKREFKPLVKLTGLYENQSKKTGETYYSGYLGGAKVLILKDKNAEPGKPGWNLFVQEKEPKPNDGQANIGYAPQSQGYSQKPPPSNPKPTYGRNQSALNYGENAPF